jgi:putative tryptophan/tyrosine transport system substrate-binding protein
MAMVARARAARRAEGPHRGLEYRWASDDEAALPRLAAELVQRNVELIVTSATPAVSASMRATRTIPIVMQTAADPVGDGLVQSLASPGGNVTGMTFLSNELTAKRLQLMKELVPNFKRAGLMAIDNRFATPSLVKALRAAASDLGTDSVVQLVRTDEDVAPGLAALGRAGASGVLLQASPFMSRRITRIAELAIAHRLPTIYEATNYVEAGGLAAYGPEGIHLFTRSAGFVDRILRGASPASLPVEQPTKFELALNLKTARALSISTPRSLLLRSDRLIE